MARSCSWPSGHIGPVAAAVLGTTTAWAGEAMAKTYTLSISGDPGARYEGMCTVMAPTGDHTIDLAGAVPFKKSFDGDGLSCRLQAEGQVVVEIVHEGSRARSATNGGTLQVSAR